MSRKERLELNRIAPCFKGFRNVVRWWFYGDCIMVETNNNLYSAKNIYGTYGFITRHC
ncbi:MAG: hypothetical protein ACLUVC_02210 [Longibaculum sp.]